MDYHGDIEIHGSPSNPEDGLLRYERAPSGRNLRHAASVSVLVTESGTQLTLWSRRSDDMHSVIDLGNGGCETAVKLFHLIKGQ